MAIYKPGEATEHNHLVYYPQPRQPNHPEPLQLTPGEPGPALTFLYLNGAGSGGFFNHFEAVVFRAPAEPELEADSDVVEMEAEEQVNAGQEDAEALMGISKGPDPGQPASGREGKYLGSSKCKVSVCCSSLTAVRPRSSVPRAGARQPSKELHGRTHARFVLYRVSCRVKSVFDSYAWLILRCR